MRRSCLILAALAAALAAPALARAGDVTLHVRHFDMLAFRWHGSGTVRFQVRRPDGEWSAWQVADDDPTWTGAADGYRIRRDGAVRDVHATTIWSRVTSAPKARTLADAGAPAIVTRSGWKANDEIVRGKPVYAPAVKLAIIHHTAGTNTYTRAQAAAIVRGIETYHVEGNGWNDIGYNFLVDRYGDIYEGRAGGIERNVVGAHAEGFNTGTVGIALIGNFTSAKPTQAMQDALVKLLAWRLDVAHVDPLSTVVYTSGGNAKFRAGKAVTLHAISGHRDTGPSECPGNAAYALLPTVAKDVAKTSLPKLYAPTVSGALGGSVRFQARLSSALPWTVTVVDQLGHAVANASGTGAAVDWTWRSTVAGKGSYIWTIAAAGARTATGTLGIARPSTPGTLAITAVAATTTSLSFTLAAAAQIDAHVVDSSGKTVLQLLSAPRPAGANAVTWDSTKLASGRYRVVVTASAGGKALTKWTDVVIDRNVTGFTTAPGDAGTTSFAFVLAQPATVTLALVREGTVVAQVFSGSVAEGPATISWDGRLNEATLPPGDYTAVLTAVDALGSTQASVPLTLG